MTAKEIAERLKGRLVGDGARVLRGVATLEAAGPEQVTWARDAAHAARAARSAAGAVLIPEGVETPSTCPATVIQVTDADSAIGEVLGWFAPPVPVVPKGVHPTAVLEAGAEVEGAAIGAHVFVGPRARVGEGTQLHAGVYVGSETMIGRDCVIWPNCVIRERVTIGDRVVIHANSTIGTDGFGYIFRGGRHVKVPQIGDVVIEDDVEIGSSTVVDRAKCGTTRIGRGTKIDNLVQIAHNVEIGPDCIIVAQCGISGSSKLEHHAVLAGQVGLVEHVRIGAGAQIAAQSGVTKDIEAGQVWCGSPAVPMSQFARQTAATRRGPEMLAELRDLARRIKQLESSTHD